jgi:hypothetical protein
MRILPSVTSIQIGITYSVFSLNDILYSTIFFDREKLIFNSILILIYHIFQRNFLALHFIAIPFTYVNMNFVMIPNFAG